MPASIRGGTLLLAFVGLVTMGSGTGVSYADDAAPLILRVDKSNISGVEDALSWATAYRDIQPAIEQAQVLGAHEIWVANGFYGEYRIYNGSATAHVVTGADGAILDNFVVRVVRGDVGAGMHNKDVSPIVRNCLFTDNIAVKAGEGENPGNHSADQDGDGQIALTELLRIIQFFNSGGFHCADDPGTSEDGFAPGPGMGHACPPHSSDYDGGHDWAINLTELLRLIQFFNSGGHHGCPGAATEDGFCPGP